MKHDHYVLSNKVRHMVCCSTPCEQKAFALDCGALEQNNVFKITTKTSTRGVGCREGSLLYGAIKQRQNYSDKPLPITDWDSPFWGKLVPLRDGEFPFSNEGEARTIPHINRYQSSLRNGGFPLDNEGAHG